MKKWICFLCCIVLFFTIGMAQSMAVNTDGSVSDGSALLDIKSNTKGLLIPRMAEAERTAISNPATGLLLYQTDVVAGYYYNAGTPLLPEWVRLTNDKTTVGFAATTTVTQTFPSLLFTKVQYLIEEYDEAGNFTPGTTSEFVAPSSAVYHFDAATSLSTPSNNLNYITINVNGVQKKVVYALSSSGLSSLQISADLKLAAGDAVDIRLFLQGGGTQSGSSAPYIWFNGHKVN